MAWLPDPLAESQLLDAGERGVARVQASVPALLEVAAARLRRQKRYARALSKGGPGAAGIEALLHKASACVADIARPEGLVMPVQAVAVARGIRIAGRVTLEGAELARDLAGGGAAALYLLTLGFDQSCAFDWLQGDYAAHHVQSDLSSEVLFALARQAFRAQRAQLPAGARLRRVSVRAEAHCGQRRHWDASKVQALLEVLDGVSPGVSVTGTGCFQPFHSLLGLTIQA